jgi:hypothetical protein
MLMRSNFEKVQPMGEGQSLIEDWSPTASMPWRLNGLIKKPLNNKELIQRLPCAFVSKQRLSGLAM